MIHRIARAHLWIALALAAITIGTGLIWSSRVAAGADAYGYVSQVDLWLQGHLHIDQGFGASVPWPLARWTFTPLGYRPEPDGYRIVPLYSPGLPLLMAGFKLIAGQCAIFWVVQTSGGILVFAAYAIGRRIGRPMVGLGAAWIVATSPTLLFMLMAPMSDVPAAAAWAVAIAFALGETPLTALMAGVAAAAAILIRPNLAPLAVVVFIWMAWHDTRRSIWFLAPVAAGSAAVAAVNARLYGSPLTPGYDMTDAYLWSYVLPNLRRYGWWLLSAETPFAVAGFAALAIPSERVWSTPASRDARWLFGGAALLIWISYVLYVPWDAWWYLRFLLPAWPMMTLGTASIAAAAYRSPSRGLRVAAVVVMAAIGVSGVTQAVRRDAFATARGEAKYIEVAKAVESLTAPDDVIISAQHSGSIRYYAGRLTVRWDTGDPAWLDHMVEWLAAHGHHPYFVLEPQEVEELRARSGPTNMSARLDWTPMVSFRGGAVTMYDGVRREHDGAPATPVPPRTMHECFMQKPPPQLRTLNPEP